MAANNDVKRLVDELRRVAKKGIANIFKQAAGVDETKNYPTLAEIVKNLVGDQRWRYSPGQSVSDVIRLAIDEMPEQFSGRAPGEAAGNNLWKGKPERAMAKILYGYLEDIVLPLRFNEDTSEAVATYDDDYLPAALKLAGFDKRDTSAGRMVRVVREDLAEAVIKLTRKDVEEHARKQLVAPQNTASNLDLGASAGGKTYIQRPQLEGRLRDLLQLGAPLIAVAGPPSVGKRTLVSQVLRGATVITIDGRSPESAQQTMADQLFALGYLPGNILPQYELKRYLDSDAGPDYLVIENAADSSLALFFAKNARARVIVTTTRKLPGIDERYCVNVDMLETDEAVALIQHELPSATDEEARTLAAAVSCHVLAIVTACAMIKQGEHASIQTFCARLRLNIAEVFDGELHGTPPALTQLYRQTLNDLAQENPQALKALELMAYLHEGEVPSAFIVFALAHALDIDSSDVSQQKAIATRAIVALRDRYLISVRQQTFLRMPELARTIIAHLVRDHGYEVCNDLRSGILALVALTRRERPGMALREFILAHSPTLLHIMNTHIDPKKRGDIVDYVYVYGWAVHDLLSAIGEEPWRVAVIVIEQPDSRYSILLQELDPSVKDMTAPHMVVDWWAPDHHRVERIIENWPTRKAMQVVVIGRDDTIQRELTIEPDEDEV